MRLRLWGRVLALVFCETWVLARLRSRMVGGLFCCCACVLVLVLVRVRAHWASPRLLLHVRDLTARLLWATPNRRTVKNGISLNSDVPK